MNYGNVAFEKAFGTPEQLTPSDLPEICFCGRSNVGKSSLINALFGRKSLARVSAKPGKTVTINFYRSGDVRFADLPGYGFAKVSRAEKERWSALMEGYFQSGRNIRMAIQLIDMRHPPTEFDLDMLTFLKSADIPYCVILTKADKLNKTQTEERLNAIPGELGEYSDGVAVLPFSIFREADVQTLQTVLNSHL